MDQHDKRVTALLAVGVTIGLATAGLATPGSVVGSVGAVASLTACIIAVGLAAGRIVSSWRATRAE